METRKNVFLVKFLPHTWMVRDDLSAVLRTATRAAAGGRADAPCRRREEELKECSVYSPKLRKSNRTRAPGPIWRGLQ